MTGLTRWEDYSLIKADRLTISPLPADIDLLEALSVFGGNALTAYLGLLKIGEPKPGETVVVSGAAGSTGSMAVQIARIVGCKAIGIAGGPAKCEWLRTDARVEAIDYKNESVAERLKALAPNGVDVFFDNVGGVIMQDVIDQMAMHGRAAVCGQIAHYNTGAAPGPRNMFRVVSHRLRIQGFIASDLMADREKALRDLRAVGERRSARLQDRRPQRVQEPPDGLRRVVHRWQRRHADPDGRLAARRTSPTTAVPIRRKPGFGETGRAAAG